MKISIMFLFVLISISVVQVWGNAEVENTQSKDPTPNNPLIAPLMDEYEGCRYHIAELTRTDYDRIYNKDIAVRIIYLLEHPNSSDCAYISFIEMENGKVQRVVYNASFPVLYDGQDKDIDKTFLFPRDDKNRNYGETVAKVLTIEQLEEIFKKTNFRFHTSDLTVIEKRNH